MINQDWASIRNTMWNYAGIIRTVKRLERARADLDYLRHRIERFYKQTRMDPKVVGLKHAAINNSRSLGAHYIKKVYAR